MTSFRQPPIKDFTSLKHVWRAEGPNTSSRSADVTRIKQLPSFAGSATAPAKQVGPGPKNRDSVATEADLPAQLEIDQLPVANPVDQQRSLEDDASRREQDAAFNDVQSTPFSGALGTAHQDIEHFKVGVGNPLSINTRERELARDRELFESELDELDGLRRREADLDSRETSLKQLQEKLDLRKVEIEDPESSRLKLEERLQAAEAVGAADKKAKSDLLSAKRALKKKSAEAAVLALEVEQLKGRYSRLAKRYGLLKVDHYVLQGQFVTASEVLEASVKELKSSSSKLDRLRAAHDQVKAVLGSMPELHIRSESLLHWLGQDGSSECIGLDENSRLGWSGVGSYESDAFDRLLIKLGVQQYALPHPSITHIVVGRLNWSKDDLLAQINMRQGKTLRVYSQEMLLAAIITGRDPLDSGDAEALDSFKRGHSALEFLAGVELDWPSVFVADTSVVEDIGLESYRVAESPLHALGYKVGESSWLSAQERRQVLLEAYEMESLPYVESEAYMKKWGTAQSHQRLWRIAFHLAMLLNGPVGRDWRKPQTRRDWLEDLEWLHANYYKRRQFRFSWPIVTEL